MKLRLIKKPKVLIVGGAIVITLWFSQSFLSTTVYQQPVNEDRVEINKREKKEVVIESGDTFATIMEETGVPHEESQGILAASHKVYDLTKIQAGKVMHLFFVENVLAAVDYDLNDDMKIVVEKNGDGFEAREDPIIYDIEQNIAEAVITSSLFADGAQAGLSDVTLLELAEIFAWDIDFSTDIREEDSFKIVYEKRFLDGEEASPGKILATRFENQGVEYQAFYYQDTGGEEGYYTLAGDSMSRQFLKSPINFGYVSSGFSYSRVNPVTKQVTPHRAIDYAAPSGTPVIATADGNVTVAGSKGGLGITVELEHGQYMSQYAHLSKIASKVERGGSVSQGEVIGYVGSTGISTGPHLQYALHENGTPVNPLTAELPPGKSLEESERRQFIERISTLQRQISD